MKKSDLEMAHEYVIATQKAGKLCSIHAAFDYVEAIKDEAAKRGRKILAKAMATHSGIHPSYELTNSVALTCGQLLEAYNFGAPDKTPEQHNELMVIQFIKNGHSGTGYYCHYDECPEEGSILLGSEPEHYMEKNHE